MPLRKISDDQADRPCLSPDHNPPSHIVLRPGTYEHTCSGCGKKTVFTVAGVYFGSGGKPNMTRPQPLPRPFIDTTRGQWV